MYALYFQALFALVAFAVHTVSAADMVETGCAALRRELPKLTADMNPTCRRLMDEGMLRPLLQSIGSQTPYILTQADSKLLCEDNVCATQLGVVKKSLNDTGCLTEIGRVRAQSTIARDAARAGVDPQQFLARLAQYAAASGRPAPNVDAMAARHVKQMVASAPLLRLDRAWGCAMSEDGEYCVSKYSSEMAKLKQQPLDQYPIDAVKTLCTHLKEGGCCLVGGENNELAQGVMALSGMLANRGLASGINITNQTTYVDICGALDVSVPNKVCKSPGN